MQLEVILILFGNDFTREQENDINAGLNYGYTLLLSIFARELVQTGCFTQLGLKHANQFNDFNLASDLMEPFRPLVDQIIYENRKEAFPIMKRKLFALFMNTYMYKKNKCFNQYCYRLYKTCSKSSESRGGRSSRVWDMSYRYMRLLLMFDMPTDTASDRKAYRKFRKF